MVSHFALASLALLAVGWSLGQAGAALLSGAGAPLKSMVDTGKLNLYLGSKSLHIL